ncbi:MAG TPA: hypothetical protein VJL81_11110 [Solirubrobacterales bacterium]|nr:hypothetical protein [Solirubrobacterales bacterium]
MGGFVEEAGPLALLRRLLAHPSRQLGGEAGEPVEVVLLGEMTGQGDQQVALVQLEGEARRYVVGEPGDQRRGEQLAGVDLVLAGQGEEPVAAVEGGALQLDPDPALGRDWRTSRARLAAADASRSGVLGRPNSAAIRPPCVLVPLGPALASRTREVRQSLLGR